MKRGTALAAITIAGAFSVVGLALSGGISKEPAPPAITETLSWIPDPLAAPQLATEVVTLPKAIQANRGPAIRAAPLLQTAFAETPSPVVEPPLITWSREITAGETLDTVLADAGLDAPNRAEIARAFGAEYDLRRLRPGHAVTLTTRSDGTPKRVELAVDDGVRIEALFGEELVTRVVQPDPERITLAREAVIESSIFAALEKADIPVRFAVDLAQMLGGTVDFRRDLSGGEALRLMWREARDGDEVIGQPELAFAALELGGSLYEIVWPDDGGGQATIYVDGEVLRVFAQPVVGARLSSVFGRRTHPVYGNVRMHTGVDFAAALGTPVQVTAPGRVSYIGFRGGYGRVVEVEHGSDTMTRYAHLSAVPEDLKQGQRVMAGDMIGRVGATGTATGPNLHYEVRVDGRPTDPLSDERLAQATEREAEDTAALERLSEARALLTESFASELEQPTT